MTYQHRLERLVDVVQELSLARDMDALAKIVRHAARELTGADGATFVLRENDLCFYMDEEAVAPLWKGQRFPVHACISGWAMEHHQSVVIEDIYADPRIPQDVYRATFVRSLVMMPIRRHRPLGAIGAYWASHHRPERREVHLLSALADSTSVALENIGVYQELENRVKERTAQLAEINQRLQAEVAERRMAEEQVRRLSLTDDLTGLYNRRGFFLLAEHELASARRHDRPGALIYLDLDGLKRCNDIHGHAAGDALLVRIAELLRAEFRETDVIARLGGDEFAVLVTDIVCGTDEILTRLRHAASRERGKPVLSFSAGAVPLTLASTLEQLLAESDQAMYADKVGRRAARRRSVLGVPAAGVAFQTVTASSQDRTKSS